MAGRFKELLKKYGKVALGVHFSVSAVSISGLYVAINNNIDVESLFESWHLPGLSSNESLHPKTAPDSSSPDSSAGSAVAIEEGMNQLGSDVNLTTGIEVEQKEKKKNRTAELVGSTGGALALAVLCNKALFPIRVPITIAITPPLSRFLARRKIIKSGL